MKSQKFQQESLRKINSSLKSRERKVIELRYGLLNVLLNSTEIAKLLGSHDLMYQGLKKR